MGETNKEVPVAAPVEPSKKKATRSKNLTNKDKKDRKKAKAKDEAAMAGHVSEIDRREISGNWSGEDKGITIG